MNKPAIQRSNHAGDCAVANGRSLQDFMDFLSSLGEKGLIPQNTATGRKAAAQKVFAVLSDAEAQDITRIDIDDVMVRFANKNRGKYTPDSLRSYQSRLRNSVVEFSEFCENPLAFRPRRRVKAVPLRKPKTDIQDGSADRSQASAQSEQQPEQLAPRPVMQILPIALRQDLIVQIAGLPFDLSRQEAQKIANIVLAHASEP